MENNICVYYNYYGRPPVSTCFPAIVFCVPHRVKPYHGRYNRHKKNRKGCIEISKTTMRQLQALPKYIHTFVNSPWVSFCLGDVLQIINLRLLWIHNHLNQYVMALSGFLAFSIFTVYQYHSVRSLSNLLHFDFIALFCYLVVTNNNFVVFLIFSFGGVSCDWLVGFACQIYVIPP